MAPGGHGPTILKTPPLCLAQIMQSNPTDIVYLNPPQTIL